jgi:hypothetical protein
MYVAMVGAQGALGIIHTLDGTAAMTRFEYMIAAIGTLALIAFVWGMAA